MVRIAQSSSSGSGVPPGQVFITWSKPLTVALLQLIKSNPTYRQALFPSGASKTLRWMVARDVCIQMFKDELWMLDAERRGLVRAMVEGGWEATDTWKSTITNPVVTHIYDLKKRFEKCKAENNVSPSWLSFDDIPSKGTRNLFKKEYPYFFLLRELLIPSTPVTSILPKQHPIASSSQPATPDSLPVVPLFGPSRRPKKRPLPVDSSDSAGSSSDDDKNAGDSDCSSEDERFTPSALPSPTIPSLAPVIKPNIHNPPVSTPIATGAAQPSKRPRTSQSSSLEEPHAVKVEKPTPPSTSMVDKGKARMSVILGRPVARPSSSGMGTGKTKGSTVADAIEVADDDMNSSDDDGVSDEDSKSSDSKSSESKSVEDGSAAGSMGVDAEDEDQEVDASGTHVGSRERSELGTAAGESSGLIDDNSLGYDPDNQSLNDFLHSVTQTQYYGERLKYGKTARGMSNILLCSQVFFLMKFYRQPKITYAIPPIQRPCRMLITKPIMRVVHHQQGVFGDLVQLVQTCGIIYAKNWPEFFDEGQRGPSRVLLRVTEPKLSEEIDYFRDHEHIELRKMGLLGFLSLVDKAYRTRTPIAIPAPR